MMNILQHLVEATALAQNLICFFISAAETLLPQFGTRGVAQLCTNHASDK
jgi:hypothetical protein